MTVKARSAGSTLACTVYALPGRHVEQGMGLSVPPATWVGSPSEESRANMPITFYLGAAAVEFKQYAAYVQRRTATRAALLTTRPD